MNANDYVRVCPVCGLEHPPAANQCSACGTLLLGMDLTLQAQSVIAAIIPAPTPTPTAAAPAAAKCPYADCAALNPAGVAQCLYCGRPLTAAPVAAATGLYNLPTALAANFVIDSVLPAGGAEAELMLLKGIKTNARVMAKLYRPGIAPKGEVLERVAGVAYAHVVRILAHGVSDGVAYEVMEYCAGGSLRDMMTAGALAPQRVRAILGEIAEALAALHDCRVIHRDLKPENILVRQAEPLDLVLTDFGIASLQDATQLFTGTARTARYAAPEAMSGVLDAAADYWSLGIIMLELLQGEHPFVGLSEPVIAHRLAVGGVDTAGVRDRRWQQLCRGLLQRDPAQRWRIGEIRRWLADDATLPEPAEFSPLLSVPYLIEGEECRTAGEIAIAFTRHWPAARKDYVRGEFEAWVRRELKDHDLIRSLHDIRERGGSADLQLFRLIRRLAPAIPPAWRGTSLDQGSILAMAGRAAEGDAEAVDWLAAVYAERVLEELSDDGYAELLRLCAEWHGLRQAFDEVWQSAGESLRDWRRQQVARGDVVVDVDSLIYGSEGGLHYPTPGTVHAGLLLSLRRPAYIEALRPALLAEAALHLEHSPWLASLSAQAQQADSSGTMALLVIKHLLPQAQQASEEGHRRIVATSKRREESLSELLGNIDLNTAEIRAAAADLALLGEDSRERLAAALEASLALSLQARAFLGADGSSGPALRSVAGAERVVLSIRDRLEQWQSSARITELWHNEHVTQAAVVAFVGVLLFAPTWLPLLLSPPALFALWRYWIVAHHRDAIRQLVGCLPRLPMRSLGGAASL